MKVEEIVSLAMELPLEQRAERMGVLPDGLDGPLESEVGGLWIREAEHRLREFRMGKTRSVPADEVYDRVIADIS